MNRARVLIAVVVVAGAACKEPDRHEAERGPLASRDDDAIDAAETRRAVLEVLRATGAARIDRPIEPFVTEVGRGVARHEAVPHDLYYFLVGCDGRVYGKGERLPRGQAWRMTVDVTRGNGDVGVSIMLRVPGAEEVRAGAGTTVDGDTLAPSDRLADADRQTAARATYRATTFATAMRQAVDELQNAGVLYDPTRPPAIPLADATRQLVEWRREIERERDDARARYDDMRPLMRRAGEQLGLTGAALARAVEWHDGPRGSWTDARTLYLDHIYLLADAGEVFRKQRLAYRRQLWSLERGMRELRFLEARLRTRVDAVIDGFARAAQLERDWLVQLAALRAERSAYVNGDDPGGARSAEVTTRIAQVEAAYWKARLALIDPPRAEVKALATTHAFVAPTVEPPAPCEATR